MRTLYLIVALVTIGLTPIIVDTRMTNAFFMPKLCVLLGGVAVLVALVFCEGDSDDKNK